MAERPIFTPDLSGPELVRTWDISFVWHAGMSVKQAHRNIQALHEAAKQRVKVNRILEISSKSPDPKGVKLSAFNLMIKTKKYNQTFSVECAYQSSKVFEHGGPYKDLREKTSREAKQDPRIKGSGNLLKFQFFEMEWGLEPKSAFYDWLYLNALHSTPDLAEYILEYRAFSDIVFNPQKSLNCQARAAALYVSLHERGLLTESVLRRKESYLEVLRGLGETAPAVRDPASGSNPQPDMFETEAMSSKGSPTKSPARIAREQLPSHWPTHLLPSEFWEHLGRTIAACGFLEETLGKAIFAFAATTEYDEDKVQTVLAKWPTQLERALTDTLYPLADVYGKVVREHKGSHLRDVEELIVQIKKVADLRNALCHGSWRAPDASGKAALHFFSKRSGKFEHSIDIERLCQLERQVIEIACTVIDSVTLMGWQFPGGAGPGEEIWSGTMEKARALTDRRSVGNIKLVE